MSWNAQAHSPGARHRCSCGRFALFVQPLWNRVVYRPDHPLCARCYRTVSDRERPVHVRPAPAAIVLVRGRTARRQAA